MSAPISGGPAGASGPRYSLNEFHEGVCCRNAGAAPDVSSVDATAAGKRSSEGGLGAHGLSWRRRSFDGGGFLRSWACKPDPAFEM